MRDPGGTRATRAILIVVVAITIFVCGMKLVTGTTRWRAPSEGEQHTK